ncbi:S41 family peptidase [Thalassospira sp.]|uniref:S41 family peptidase n=1 Tax=Thalassospira sp. TaxID=1912094 RepID=UPI0027326E1A|nr:S41 family peptidase [Thalassospira sp.]MDP2698086.1 S41 family peptidase [Thalassospira sp.]
MAEHHAAPSFVSTFAGSLPNRMAGLCVTGLLLAGCATGDIAPPVGDIDLETRDVLTQTIELLDTRYIDPLTPEQIVVNALDGLTGIDPKIGVEMTPEHVALRYDGRDLDILPLPDMQKEDSSSGMWADVVLRGLAQFRLHSPMLRLSPDATIQARLIDGAMTGLDRYSRYEGPEQARNARNRREGYIGIGVRLVGGNGYPLVKLVHDNGPAIKAGLQIGDQIISIDGIDLYNQSSLFASDLLQGKADSIAELEINPAGSNRIKTIQVVRERVIAPTVFTALRRNVVVARITGFNNDTARSLAAAIDTTRKNNNGHLAGVVMDLRGNRGGLLQQGVDVADLFLAGGPIGNTHARISAARHVFEANEADLINGAPLVVLIDGNTASSAELVAAALQDRGRAVLVGSTSFGKGSVQAINDLINSGTLTFTWSRLSAPSGYTFDRIGLHPAICTVDIPADDIDILMQNAVAGKKKLDALMVAWRHTNYSDEQTRRTLRDTCPPGKTAGELDVDVAVKLIENISNYNMLSVKSDTEIADTNLFH